MNLKLNSCFVICLIFFSMFPIPIASATSITDSNGFEYTYVGDGIYQISKSGSSTYLGFAMSGVYNENPFVRSFNDFVWNDPVQSSTNVYDVVDTSGNWKTQFYFNGDTKILNEITNPYPLPITNSKFYYVMSVDVGDKIRIGKEVRTVSTDSNYHITNLNYNLNEIVPQMVVSNIGLNYQDLLDTGFDITDLYLCDGGVLGYPNQKVIAVGFTKGEGVIESGQTVVIDPTIEDGMTGTTTTTLTGLSGNQSISVPDGSSYDLNITNNQPSVWTINGTDFSKRVLWTLNTTSENLTDFQVERVTSYDSDMQVDMDDRQLTYYENDTLISFWDETIINSTNATGYVKVPKTSTMEQQQYWMYYDNSEASSASSIDNTFIFSDEFNTYDSGKWSGTYTSVGNGIIELNDGEILTSDTNYGVNTEFIAKWSCVVDASGDSIQVGYGKEGDANQALNQQYGSTNTWYARNYKDGTGHLGDMGSLSDNIYYRFITSRNGSSSVLFSNGIASHEEFTYIPTVDIPINLFTRSDRNEKLQVDYIFIRKYTTIEPTWLADGEEQTASGTINITATVTGDNNTQSYNTSQSREFTLTPTGETNNVFINTTSTDYDVTITTYWTEDTTLQTETATAGYAKQYINYTPSFNITSADLNTTFTFNFSAQDYIGTATSTLNDVSKTTTRDGQDINASVGSLTEATPYWWNVTVPYNNIFTLSEQSDITAFLGVSKQFSDSTYNDPEGLPIDSRLWNFGDGGDSSSSNPNHTYITIGNFNANYSATETATVSPQTIVKEFNVSVEVQPPQNVTTVPHQTNVSIDWDDYTYADKYSVYELEDGFPYVGTNPTVDGVKDAIYDYAHEFLIFSPNPVNPGDYETSYPVRTSLGAYFFHEAVDNDDKLGDDDLIYYFDLDNDGLTVDDPAWKITNNVVKKYLWNGGLWQVTGVTDAVGESTGGGTLYPKHELFIPIAELGANWTNGSIVKVLVKREDSSLSPDVITWYPYGNINNTDTSLWQEMALNELDSYTWLANVTLSNYTATNLTPFTIYHGAVSAWNGTDESYYTLFDVITEDIPVYNVSGYVFDDLGNTLAGAIVYSCNGFVHEVTQTDIYGYWIGYNFREGNYTICANKSGYADNSIDIYVSTNLTNQNITLPAFEMTDWMLWEKLLEIEDAIDDLSTDFTPTEGNYEMLSSTYNIFLLLLGACFILAFPKRGEVTERDTGLNNVLFSFLGTILSIFLAQIIVSGQVVESFAFESQIYDPLQHYFLYLIAVIMFVVFALNAVYYVRQRVD